MDKRNELQSGSMRNAVFEYVKKEYKSKIEYLWKSTPDAAVFRHEDNRKWYGLVMEVSKKKLGIAEDERIDVLNVKIDDAMLYEILLQQEGYFPGYHMNKRNWMSVLLDGTLSLDAICDVIDISYKATASKRKREQIRPPKEWVVPANPKYYDIEHMFDDTDTVDWKQGNGIKVKDTVFLYVAAPISAILYKCKVVETDMPYNYHDENLTIRSLMKLKLIKKYKPSRFTFDKLKNDYGVFAIRGPRSVPNSLSAALKK